MFNCVQNYMQKRFGVVPLGQAQPALEGWLETPLGQSLLEQEQHRLDDALGCLFGYHLMELSISRQLDLSAGSRVQHRFSLSPNDNDGDGGGGGDGRAAALADIEYLPLASESIDVALLHHVLEFTEHPHQLLRETSRALIPRGHVVIVGFNPVSSFGLCKPFAGLLGRRPHWRYHSLRLGRVLDWLRLLDFEPVEVSQGFYRPPLQQAGIMKRLHWLERWGNKYNWPMGGFYTIVARKDVTAMTPIKPSWKAYNPISDLVGHKPSPRLVESVKKVRGQVAAGDMNLPK